LIEFEIVSEVNEEKLQSPRDLTEFEFVNETSRKQEF
jgi:hypothetical protein